MTGLREVSLPFQVNDLLVDEDGDRLYVTVASTSSTRPGQLVVIDPGDGTVLASITLGSNPGPMSMSGDGSVLYVGLSGSGRVERLDPSDLSSLGGFALGTDGGSTLRAADLAVRPGTTDHLLVSLERSSGSPAFSAVALFVDGVRMPASITGFTGPNEVEFDGPDRAVGMATEAGGWMQRLAVSERWRRGDGTSAPFDLSSGYGFAIHGDRVHTDSGEVFDRTTGDLLATIPVDGATAFHDTAPALVRGRRRPEQPGRHRDRHR